MKRRDPYWLYLGCGNHRMEGFTHVEVNATKNKAGAPDIFADISNHIPLADGSAELIFSRGTMEHLTYDELLNCFLECHRLLRVGGAVRMVVPDLDQMIDDYQNKVLDRDNEIDDVLPIENHTDYFVARLLYHDHFYLHNLDTLSRALTKAGFELIQERGPGKTSIPEASAELHKAEISRVPRELIVEGIRTEAKPSAVRSKKKLPTNPLIRILAATFNIKIARFNHRAPAFPERAWWKRLWS